MANAQLPVSTLDNEFLFFSNPFTVSQASPGSLLSQQQNSLGIIGENSRCSAERLFRLIKNGTFALCREQILEAFESVGGLKHSSHINLKGIIKLCVDIVAESHKKGKSGLRLWFDPLTGRLELESANGLTDSLQIAPRRGTFGPK